MFTKLLLDKEVNDAGNIDKNVFEIMTLLNDLVLSFWFKDQNLVFFSVWFIKNVFSAKIWILKTLLIIVKYKLQIVKTSPG